MPPDTAIVGEDAEFVLEDPNTSFIGLLEIDPDAESVTLMATFPDTVPFIQFFDGDRVTLSDLDWVDDPLAILVAIENFSTSVSNAEREDISVGPHSISVDLAGMVFEPGDIISFDLIKGAAVIPLPATALLLLGGILALGVVRERRSGASR